MVEEHDNAQHVAEHGVADTDFIMHHLLQQPVIKLPTVFGIDLTITNHVVMMWVACALLILSFAFAFRTSVVVPTGLANLLEAFVVYLRNDIILPNLGENGKQYVPYLLNAFFFILFCNLLGLVPFGSTATGNIGVTAGLALHTLVVGQYAGIRAYGFMGYLKNFIPPGMPLFVRIILVPVEIIGLATKHFALALRLFANMMAGHITILALMMIIFIFKSWLVSPFPLLIMVFSALLEILIAFIQAYVFTILSAIFIGRSVSAEH